MPWSARTDRRRWLVVAGIALVLAWMAAPATVPFYDGCCAPDEPYRYIDAPSGYRNTPAPSVGRAVLHLRHAQVRPGFVNTSEVGPQASLYVPAGALAVPSAASQLTLTVTPEPPPADTPSDGQVDGNVYRIDATADSQKIALRVAGQHPALQLRAPSSKQPGPVFERHDSAGWHRESRTTRTGIDVYQTEIGALGDWALVQLNVTGASKDPGINSPLLAMGLGVLVTTGLLLGLRISRREHSP